jgi:hypothetical protein
MGTAEESQVPVRVRFEGQKRGFAVIGSLERLSSGVKSS